MKCKFLRMSILSFLVLFPLVASCREGISSCKKIEINSAGEYFIKTERIVDVAPGAGGRDGVVNYVLISVPSRIADDSFHDVGQAILMADIHRLDEPECKRVTNDSYGDINCGYSLPSLKLKLIVKFRSVGQTIQMQKYEQRVKVIADNIVSDALNPCLH